MTQQSKSKNECNKNIINDQFIQIAFIQFDINDDDNPRKTKRVPHSVSWVNIQIDSEDLLIRGWDIKTTFWKWDGSETSGQAYCQVSQMVFVWNSCETNIDSPSSQ